MNRNHYLNATRALLLFLLVGLVSCSEEKGTDPVQTSAIKGKVVDMNSGSPIAGALVSTDPATGSTTTDANGRYELTNVLPGSYTVVVTKGGYRTSGSSVQVLGNTAAILDVQLEPKATVGGGEEKKDTIITVLSFDGVNDMVVVADAEELDLSDESFTIEMWIRPSSLKTKADNGVNDQWNCIVSHGPSNSNLDYLFGIMDRKPMIYVESYSAGHVASKVLEVDKWHHMAAVQDRTANRLYIYVDGLRISEGEAAEVGESTLRDLFIGARESNGTGTGAHFYSGVISDLRIWNVARTGIEIAENRGMNLVGDEPGLVALWRMDEGEGGTVEDITGNGHIGTLSGDPEWTALKGPIVN